MTETVRTIFVLLVCFQVKHVFADFVFQRTYMLNKGAKDWSFVWPLTQHCLVHASFTFLIALFFSPSLLWLAGLDFIIHFFVDRLKSGPKYFGRFNDYNKNGFWICLGFDQMIHHLTDYLLIYLIVSAGFSA